MGLVSDKVVVNLYILFENTASTALSNFVAGETKIVASNFPAEETRIVVSNFSHTTYMVLAS
jgi:hypothetical protein